MITKDEMRSLLNATAEYLESLDVDNDIIFGTLAMIKDYAVRNGIYKDESSEGDNKKSF